MPLSDDTKVLVASNLVVAHELRRLTLATLNVPSEMDVSEEIMDVFQRISARISDTSE